MNCATEKATQWVVYDAKTKEFIHLSHKEFGELLEDMPVKLVDKKIWNHNNGTQIYIDGILNSSFFK